MQTPINQDIDKFKDDFFKGLTMKETMWGAAGFLVGVILIGFQYFYLHIPVEIAVFIALPFIAILAINGFYTRNGLSFIQLTLLKFKISKSPTLVYKCPDPRDEKIKKFEKILEEKKGEKKNGTKKTKAV